MSTLVENKISIAAVPYSDDLREDWEEFIEHEALNSTFLHTRRFFDHNSNNVHEDASLMFYKENKIIAVFPAVIHHLNSYLILNSHLRATYGGFIVSDKLGLEEAVIVVQQVILFARQKKVDQIFIRNPFRIFQSQQCDETDYAMWYHGFKIKSRELEIAIPLNREYEIIRSQYSQNTLRNVRKGSKLVNVRISNDFEEYWTVLEKCLMNQYGKKPTHDYASITKLRANINDNKILLFAAYHNCKLIGGVVIFDCNELVLHAQYIASDYDFKHLCPVHAIIDYIIEWGNKKCVKYLNLGMANEEEGKKMNYGLFRFKESFGGRGVLRETMYINL
jgi:hypothetical protein